MGFLENVSDELRALLTTAQDEARAMQHGYVGTEHLLIAVLARPTGPGAQEALSQGASPEKARHIAREVFEETTNAARFIPDEETLASVGVNLEEVRRRAESEFGAGAVAMRIGAPAFTPRAKLALDEATAAADSMDRIITDPDDLLVGILADRESVAYRALSSMCADLGAVEHAARHA